jgi:UDP-glucose 4-epimerase
MVHITQKKILVTGGAGFIGSHAVKMLDQMGYAVLLFDCVSNPTIPLQHGLTVQGDLSDPAALDALFSAHQIAVVMHFAAYIDVGESVRDPAKYYRNNLVNSLNLLEVMRRHAVDRFIFSSSAAIFGKPVQLPIAEEHPCAPISSYGESKLMVEKILRDFDAAYGLKFCALRYFNAAGGDPEGRIRRRAVRENNLIPLALNSLVKGASITVFGSDYPTPDGSCIRDYIHVEDIARAHVLALQQLLESGRSAFYNLGNGQGYSVWEVIRTVEKVTGRQLDITVGARRVGDVPVLLADSSKARRELNWQPRYPELETMIAHAWAILR